MLQLKLTWAAVIVAFVVATGADAQNANRVRNALSGSPSANACEDSPVVTRWCATLGVEAAYWIDKGVSLAVDRHFEQRDRALANKTGIIICYNDDHCTHPE